MRDYASLYSSLLSDLGMEACPDSHIFTDMDDRTAASVSLANSFYKKLCPTGTSRNADAAALEKFLAINRSLSVEAFRFDASNEVESLFWDYFRNHLNRCLGPHESEELDLDFIRDHLDVGPGAAQKADSRTLHTKLFEGELSYYSEDNLRLYRAAIVSTGLWADAEMHRFSQFGVTKVRGNKLFFAPKNAEISRVCGTEANVEMLIQKAICAYAEIRLEQYFGIALSTQPDYNRRFACKGSYDGTICTVDLVSASDYIGVPLFTASLDNCAFKRLVLQTRAKFSVLPDGSNEELRMVSTMGNGYTFPLQTIIFASAVKAVYDLMGFPSECPRTQFGVFGDDICIRKEAYVFFNRMLSKLGFKVNVGKSFSTGPFRESCGEDYARGLNIRGVYIRTLETPQQVYSAINRLNRWSARHDIGLPNVMKTLYSWTRRILVPLSESDDAGIHVPFKLTKPRLTNSYWFKYRTYVKRKTTVKVDETWEVPKVDPTVTVAVGLGFLSGRLRRRDVVLGTVNPNNSDPFCALSAWEVDWGISYTVRDKMGARPRYKIVSKSLPFWDYIPVGRYPVDNSDPFNTKRTDYEEVDGDERRDRLTPVSHQRWVSLMVASLT
jgi:hypothetical protein